MLHHIQALGALSQLKCKSEVWECVLFQSFELLEDSNDAPLAATVDFIFKAALHCQHLPEAVSASIAFFSFLLHFQHFPIGCIAVCRLDLSVQG